MQDLVILLRRIDQAQNRSSEKSIPPSKKSRRVNSCPLQKNSLTNRGQTSQKSQSSHLPEKDDSKRTATQADPEASTSAKKKCVREPTPTQSTENSPQSSSQKITIKPLFHAGNENFQLKMEVAEKMYELFSRDTSWMKEENVTEDGEQKTLVKKQELKKIIKTYWKMSDTMVEELWMRFASLISLKNLSVNSLDHINSKLGNKVYNKNCLFDARYFTRRLNDLRDDLFMWHYPDNFPLIEGQTACLWLFLPLDFSNFSRNPERNEID